MDEEQVTGLVHFIDQVGIWSVNPYQYCSFRCIYCIAASQGESTPWCSETTLVPELRRALEQVPRDAELFLGAIADAYPPVEERLRLTRQVLEELSRQGRPFCINTKSVLVCRDISVLTGHAGHCDVYLSLCSLDDAALQILEPWAPSAAERLAAVDTLYTAGVDVNIDASPWIPGVTRAKDLIARLPAGVGVQFAPLDIRRFGEDIVILGNKFSQDEIDTAYFEEKHSVGEVPGVRWRDPLPREA